jgi:hypothetical protein
MKKSLVIFFLLCAGLLPAQERYIFFLHNRFLEEATLEDAHPEYGKCEYREIIAAFKKAGFTVLSEIRPRNTNVQPYAGKIAAKVDSLLAKGIKPGNITVIGTSKGGFIAQHVSSKLNNPQLNFVFIGSCSDNGQGSSLNFSGNILSIYEKSDAIGTSCVPMKNKSIQNVSHFKELELNTGLRHGFLFKASPQWIDPCINWAKGNYN